MNELDSSGLATTGCSSPIQSMQHIRSGRETASVRMAHWNACKSPHHPPNAPTTHLSGTHTHRHTHTPRHRAASERSSVRRALQAETGSSAEQRSAGADLSQPGADRMPSESAQAIMNARVRTCGARRSAQGLASTRIRLRSSTSGASATTAASPSW